MNICEEVQGRLAEDGIEAVRAEPRLAEHLAGCPDCTAIAEALTELDAAMAALPQVDAPESAVEATLRTAAETTPVAPRGAGRRQVAGALAATLVIAAFFGVGQHLLRGTSHLSMAALDRAERKAPAPAGGQFGLFGSIESNLENAYGSDEAEVANEPLAQKKELAEGGDANRRYYLTAPSDDRPSEPAPQSLDREARLVARLQQLQSPPEARAKSDANASDAIGRKDDKVLQALADSGRRGAGEVPHSIPQRIIIRPRPAPSSAVTTEQELAKNKEALASSGQAGGFADTRQRAVTGAEKPAEEVARAENFRGGERSQMVPGPALGKAFERDSLRSNAFAPDAGRAEARAQAFLARVASTDGLAYQDPTGYWANTYIPGDPAMRLVRARLDAWNRRPGGQELALERDARQALQPFDRPTDAALALYLDADTASIQGKTRLRVQVGLKGAERLGGHRPAMNVALVLDARRLDRPELGTRIRALVAALEDARQAGDRFSLVVAGPGGGVAVPAEAFRYGPLQVALANLGKDTGAPAVSLIDAVAEAAESVAQGEDAVLGSSLVLLATGADLGPEMAALEGMAHENAVGGVPMSVVNLGGAVAEQVDRLVAAGQGNRRNLASAEAAEALVDTELHAASRVVARAVRLRIHLAPGVKLVDVLGSRRLDQPQAQRVRQAEQAIDRRIARNLGIAADRGDDEEGIQIVIPNFYAGDAHVILLDVVAERPGPIADVTARYKDVVRLKNGVAEARLTLPAGEHAPGPLELNVLKNLLAHEVAERTRRIGLVLEQGRAPAPALLPEIAALRELVLGLSREVPGWATDADLAADEKVLAGYLNALRSPLANDPEQRRLLAQSLRYVAFAKLHTRRD